MEERSRAEGERRRGHKRGEGQLRHAATGRSSGPARHGRRCDAHGTELLGEEGFEELLGLGFNQHLAHKAHSGPTPLTPSRAVQNEKGVARRALDACGDEWGVADQ